ncbi:unnamed protein product [Rotaria socialis]|uniref:DUF4371 domain-containing protein n=2 Tax=Rotaria socialis TaxID=392032 RepID=A0A820TSX7_9BILA|nr:unnamed protein product [Rotaria socialis]
MHAIVITVVIFLLINFASSGLIKHALSQSHIIATKNYLSYKQREETDSSVIKKLDSGRAIQIRKNRDHLVKIYSTLHILARQMISFSGHEENDQSSNRGNFLEILHWAAKTDSLVQSIFQDSSSNANYLSHDIQNELLHIMSDECRDISCNQQLSIVIRFVRDLNGRTIDSSNVVKEYFLGFVELEEFDAGTLANKIVDFLNSLNISLQSCICLCFDGASVMPGCQAGVHVLLRKHMPKGIYIHCSAHRLNLVVSDTSLDDISEEDGGSRSTNAGGLLIYVKKSMFIITSFILHRLFDLRNEQSFQQVYNKTKEFCDANEIDFIQQYKSHRVTTIPVRFEAFVISSTLGQCEVISSSTDFMNQIYFPLIDCMLVELNDRFSSKRLSLMKSISTVYPEKVQKKHMAFSNPSSTKSTIENIVNDEKFAQIYIFDENAVQLLDNERTIMTVKPGLPGCALGIHSYSSGIHCVRIRVDNGYPVLGIRSRNIPPIPDEYCWGSYSVSPSTYGWQKDYGRLLNGRIDRYELKQILNNMKRDSHVYTITLNCDEHQLSIINEDTKEQDEIEVDVGHAPFPWCLYVDLPRCPTRISLI